MASRIEPARKSDKRQRELSKSIEELAELFEQRKARAGTWWVDEVEEVISAYLRPRKAIEHALKVRTDRKLKLAVAAVEWPLRELGEQRVCLSDCDRDLLQETADDVRTTVELLTAELEKVMPQDWGTQGYAGGPKEAALTVVARLSGLTARRVRDRIRNVTDREAWLAKRERIIELIARGGEARRRATEELRQLRKLQSQSAAAPTG